MSGKKTISLGRQQNHTLEFRREFVAQFPLACPRKPIQQESMYNSSAIY
jgi:hypothetical protein